jgi:hypothetical protein
MKPPLWQRMVLIGFLPVCEFFAVGKERCLDFPTKACDISNESLGPPPTLAGLVDFFQ